jgi:hypothetical protein
MREIFKDDVLNRKFESTVNNYEAVRKVLSNKVNMDNPAAVLKQMEDIQSVQALAAHTKASLTYLCNKYALQKLPLLDQESGKNANEKKYILNAEMGDVLFYDEVMELLIKEMHYQVEILRSSLSYLKSEIEKL